jgi:ribonuclease HII
MKSKEPRPDLQAEISLGFLLPKIVIGVDEVGRGCLAGPVVAAAAVLHSDTHEKLWFDERGIRRKGRVAASHPYRALLEVKDSKMIPEPERAPLRDAVMGFVRGHAVAEASVEEIEHLNILYASHLAMERAVAALEAKLQIRADAVLVDGHIVPKCFLGRGHPLIKGDQKSLTIACASIMAKVYRDDLMSDLDTQYPGYGMKGHKGYPTPYHKAQIRELGVTSIHRKGFKGVLLENTLEDQEDFFFTEVE